MCIYSGSWNFIKHFILIFGKRLRLRYVPSFLQIQTTEWEAPRELWNDLPIPEKFISLILLQIWTNH